MKKKLSKSLHKRTKLSPEQLDRVKASYGNGEGSKYRANGVQSLALTRALAKAKKRAKRYLLYSDKLGRRLYVADRDKMALDENENALTFIRGQALEFIEGFDSVDLKKAYYNKFYQETVGVAFNWQWKNL